MFYSLKADFPIKKRSEACKRPKNSDWLIFFWLYTHWTWSTPRRCSFYTRKSHESWKFSTSERSVKMKANLIISFHIYIKRNLKHFGSNETVKIYSLKKYVNII